jgi:uncharacterized damage-inducible protein DinB
MTEQKTTKAETFKHMFQFQMGIFNNALENLDDKKALIRMTNNTNHMNWLLGHILHCRYMLLNMLGNNEQNPFGQLYWTAIEDKPYPKIQEVISLMPGISQRLDATLSSLNDEKIEQENEDKSSLEGTLVFFAYHEAYHLGQLGLLRKAVGLGALKSY